MECRALFPNLCYLYILVGQTPVPCEDLHEWAMWMEDADRHVGHTIIGPYSVSTVFTGRDFGMGRIFGGQHERQLFETKVFPVNASPHFVADLDEYARLHAAERAGLNEELLDLQLRYPTWSEAETGHEQVVSTIELTTQLVRTPEPDFAVNL